MRALAISGGGSKGAFAGGVAEYLIREEGREYDLFLGSSTGSLLISHLALNKIDKVKRLFTSVTQNQIFDNCPFTVKTVNGVQTIGIHHFNVLKNFFRGRKTFGESNQLRQMILNSITPKEFEALKTSNKDVVITVSNLSTNHVEYKKLSQCHYLDYVDWIWISCNYVPFMTLATKDKCEYGDGGLGTIIPIEEALRCGATEIDAIVLDTEFPHTNRMPSRNPFDAMSTIFGFMADRIEYQNIKIGKLMAADHNALVNLYYTPSVLTTNSLVFDKDKMAEWWKAGFDFAAQKSQS
ncbi:MAG: patatin-like phospholipase family protein [Flavobacteriia bacterium]|nr:patatin-like phospholipase family protein [Flavobacteriia bacterium]